MLKKQDNDKEQDGQPKGLLDGKKESTKEKVDNTKQKVKKIKKVIEFLKKHPLIAKMLFWVILAIIIIIVLTMIIYAIKGGEESNASLSLEATIENMQKINMETSEDGEEEESDTYKMTAGTIVEEDGKYFYELLYGDDSEEKNRERINSIKAELSKEGIEIYDNHCLLFLAVMVENGLDISLYNKADLEAMYMFLKAEIATSSLDLGTEGETLEDKIVPEGGTYLESNYDENDYSNDRISGTIKVQRVIYAQEEEATEGQSVGETIQLKYISLEKFEEIVANDSSGEESKNYFTLDEENNLLVAGYRSSSIEYIVSDYTVNEETNEEAQAELQDYYNNSDEVDCGRGGAYKYKSVPYLNYISKYTMPFSFLMTLLATTDNAEFCKEFAKVAEQSSITITLHSEYSTTYTEITNKQTKIDKVYAFFNADVKGTVKQTGQWTETNSTDGREPADPSDTYPGGRVYQWYSADGTMEYRHTKGDGIDKYEQRTVTNVVKSGTLTNKFITGRGEISDRPSELNNIETTEEGELDYESIENLENFTEEIVTKYTLTTKNTNLFYSYSMEVTEVDNWYEYYSKTYSKVENKEKTEDSEAETKIMPEKLETNREGGSQYTDGIPDNEKKRATGDVIGGEDFEFDPDNDFKVTRSWEEIYTYGKEEIATHYVSNKYKRAGTEKELVQVKVQRDNETALLSIVADAFGVQNKNEINNSDEEESEDGEEENKKEEIYGITDEKDNSFLYVYDKYEGVKDNFHSIDEWAYEMLDKRDSCKGTKTLLRYLIFLYDGTDLGVTEYDLTLLKPSEFESTMSKGSAIAEWLKSYEYENLREWRNGQITYEQFLNGYMPNGAYLGEDGKVYYRMYRLNVEDGHTVDHSWNFSYGLLMYKIYSDGSLSSCNYSDEELEKVGLNSGDILNSIRATDSEAWIANKRRRRWKWWL